MNISSRRNDDLCSGELNTWNAARSHSGIASMPFMSPEAELCLQAEQEQGRGSHRKRKSPLLPQRYEGMTGMRDCQGGRETERDVNLTL